MVGLYKKLAGDIRLQEGLKSCINCGTCTAICAAAEFYNYDPRNIVDTVQSKDDRKIEELLKGDEIWYCGECMSCKTRCPRGNTPGLVIMALRNLAMETGLFVESEKGRQQLALKRVVGGCILKYGYCLYAPEISYEMHPEQGPVWDWEQKHLPEVMQRLGANYKGDGPGILRKIPAEAIDELQKIFEVTGAMDRFALIEKASEQKAFEMGLQFDDSIDNEYFKHIYTANNQKHTEK
jgi:heterodisulfide reductase subunit C1